MIILGTCLYIAMSSVSFMFAMAYKQARVVVLVVHSNFYSRWYIAFVVVHQVLGHRNYHLAEDHLGPYVFITVCSNVDL